MQAHCVMIGIAFNDNLVGKISNSLSYSTGGCQVDLAVRGNVYRLENGDIHLAHVAVAQILCHERKMQVAILYLLGIYRTAHRRVRNERGTETDGIGTCKHAVYGVARRGSRIEVNLERLASGVRLFGTLGNLGQNSLRCSGKCKTTYSYSIAIVNVHCSLLGSDNRVAHVIFLLCLLNI